MTTGAELERHDARADASVDSRPTARGDLGCGAVVRSRCDGDREAGHGEARALAGTQDELLAGERGEGGLDLARVLTDAGDEGVEGGGATSTGEAEEGAEDGDLGAHGSHYVQH